MVWQLVYTFRQFECVTSCSRRRIVTLKRKQYAKKLFEAFCTFKVLCKEF